MKRITAFLQKQRQSAIDKQQSHNKIDLFRMFRKKLTKSGAKQRPDIRTGTTEFITVSCGTLEIEAADKYFTVTKGESIRFKGDTIHSYRNTGTETTVLYMILYNP